MNPEWVEAGMVAAAEVDLTRDPDPEVVEAIIAAVEPLIRADERERYECPMPCCDDYEEGP